MRSKCRPARVTGEQEGNDSGGRKTTEGAVS